MSGYTPVFAGVFQGSLCGKYPDLPVWLVMLAMSDKNGVVDAHPAYIATVSGLPQEDIEAAIARFCEPDTSSRTPDEEGRRLEPLPDRGFGWKIVNHSRYREKARLQAQNAAQVADGRNAEKVRRYKERQKAKQAEKEGGHPQTPADSLSNANANANNKKKEESAAKPRATRKCPKDFTVTDEMRAWAKEKCPGIDVDRATEAFRDHTFASTRTDWAGTWRNWMRREKPKPGNRTDTREVMQEWLNAPE